MSIGRSNRKMCPDLIVNDFVTKTIKTVPFREGYSTIRVTLKSERSAAETSGCAAMTTVSVVCRKGCLVDIVDVAVKSAPKDATLRRRVPIKELFAREIYFYDTVLAEFTDFQRDSNEKFLGAPTLIAASLDEEAIILRNSSADGSPKFEKWVGELTQEHTGAILKELARLHALSLAFGKANPKKLEEFRRKLNGGHLSMLEHKETLRIIHRNLKASLKFLSEDVVKKLKKFDGEIDGFLDDVLNEAGRGQVVVNGDPTRNFLFSYEKTETANVVSRAKMTDWHLVKFGSPILDVSLFLFANEDFANLDKSLEDYHAFLTLFLQEFHCDSLPYRSVDEEWRKYSKFGLALSFFNFGSVVMDGKRPGADEEDLSCDEFLGDFVQEPNDEFVRRIRDVVKFSVDSRII